jgi:hypothetical protein
MKKAKCEFEKSNSKCNRSSMAGRVKSEQNNSK